MEARPNIIVGAIGLIVFIITGTIIAVNFRALTGTHTYEATVEVFDENLGTRYGFAPPQGSQVVAYDVPYENVSAIRITLTWTDRQAPVGGSLVPVRLEVRDPSGTLVAAAGPTTGGLKGIVLEADHRPVPVGGRYDATNSTKDDEFLERWPAHPEDRGVWNITIITSSTDDDANGISFTLEFETLEYYRVNGPVKVEAPAAGVK